MNLKKIKNIKISEKFFVAFLCIGLKVFAWFLLLFGIAVSFGIATTLAPVLLVSRWAGVAVLSVFIAMFLFINLAVKIAQMVLAIKLKVVS